MSIAPDAAPLWRRTLAGGIDMSLGTALFGVLVSVPAIRAPAGERVERIERLIGRLDDPWVARGITVVTPPIFALAHRARSPGSRAVGIRRVDARTGGPESLRSALIRIGLGTALSPALRRLNRPGHERMGRRRADIDARLAQAREQLVDDPDALERATAEIALESVRGWPSATIRLLALGSTQPLTALLSPRRQTVIERIAAVAVVHDRR